RERSLETERRRPDEVPAFPVFLRDLGADELRVRDRFSGEDRGERGPGVLGIEAELAGLQRLVADERATQVQPAVDAHAAGLETLGGDLAQDDLLGEVLRPDTERPLAFSSADDASQNGRMENLVGEDPARRRGERAVLELIDHGQIRPRRADLQLERELEHVLLVAERDPEHVLLLRLDRASALALDRVDDQIAVDLVAALERETDLLRFRGEEPALSRDAVG